MIRSLNSLKITPEQRDFVTYLRSSRRRCSVKKVFVKISQNLQENTCVWVSFLIKSFLKKTMTQEACNFIKKETLTQVFSCEFCEISKKTFFHRTSPVAVSVTFVNLWNTFLFVTYHLTPTDKVESSVCLLKYQSLGPLRLFSRSPAFHLT